MVKIIQPQLPALTVSFSGNDAVKVFNLQNHFQAGDILRVTPEGEDFYIFATSVSGTAISGTVTLGTFLRGDESADWKLTENSWMGIIPKFDISASIQFSKVG